VYALAMSSAGTLVAAGTTESYIRLLDPRTGQKVIKLKVWLFFCFWFSEQLYVNHVQNKLQWRQLNAITKGLAKVGCCWHVWQCAVLCVAVLCRAAMCCALLCCPALCCAMLCCAVLFEV
jgi:hypothetical protein